MKKYLWLSVRFTGLLWVWRLLQPKSVTILMLHGVVDAHVTSDWQPSWNRTPVDWLEHCLAVFAKTHQFISLSDAVKLLATDKKIKKNYIAFTFDDGYRNNLTVAWPVLKKFGVKPCFFVVSSHVTNRTVYWIDRLDYALQHADLVGRDFAVGEQVFSISSNDLADVRRLHFLLRRAIKQEFDDEQMYEWLDKVCGDLERQSGKSLVRSVEADPFAAILNWQELIEAQADGVEIGSHTSDHSRLTCVSSEHAQNSLSDSKSVIEKKLGSACMHFCYPNGDVNKSVERWVEDAGYHSGISCETGSNYPGSNLYRLKRVSFPVQGLSNSELLAFICGFKKFASGVVKRLR